MSSLLGTLALLEPAHACGGFTCDNPAAPPVLQAAERIVFAIDPDSHRVEMHVQVEYAGTDDFAWIVPVPQPPELHLSTAALFTQLAIATQPTFTLRNRDVGECVEETYGSYSDMAVSDYGGSSATADSDFYEVSVVGESVVGPYQTVTLRGTSAADVIGWLQDQGYALRDDMADKLAPYVSEDAYFVALKLNTGATTGDLAPLAMTFTADAGTVPVQLTSISATPDMRMEAYVFSAGRGLPESYLHVRINDAAIDWWTAGSNYADVITQAANEAGGHAFATDFHGATSQIPVFHRVADWPVEALRNEHTPDAFLAELRAALDVVPPELFPVLEEAFGLTAGTGQTAWTCPSCLALPVSFDPGPATDRLEAEVFAPLDAAQALLDDHPLLSRLTSSLDAVEMTVDPVFVVNEDLADDFVSNQRTAGYAWLCDGGDRDESLRRLELADGRRILIPSQQWLVDHHTTEFQWIEDLGDIKAQVIEQTGETGDPVVLVDHTRELARLARLHNQLLEEGCGCAEVAPMSAGSVALAGLLGLSLRRRRR